MIELLLLIYFILHISLSLQILMKTKELVQNVRDFLKQQSIIKQP